MRKLWNYKLRDDEMRKLWYIMQMLLHVRRGGSMKDFSWEPVFYLECVLWPSRKDCTSFCFWHRAEPRKLQVLKSCTRGSQLGLQHVSSCKGGHVLGCQAIPTSPRPRLSDCQGYSRRFRGLFLVPCRVPRSICSPSFSPFAHQFPRLIFQDRGGGGDLLKLSGRSWNNLLLSQFETGVHQFTFWNIFRPNSSATAYLEDWFQESLQKWGFRCTCPSCSLTGEI